MTESHLETTFSTLLLDSIPLHTIPSGLLQLLWIEKGYLQSLSLLSMFLGSSIPIICFLGSQYFEFLQSIFSFCMDSLVGLV